MSTRPTTQHVSGAIDVNQFNTLAAADARSLLQSCLAVPRWVDELLSGRPFSSADDLLARASTSALALTETEVAVALARHPRIGEPAGPGHDREFSVREQSGVDPHDASLSEALQRGNAEYEKRFDRVFLIRAAGRSAEEILAAQQRRLTHSPEAELSEVVAQLGEIAMLRLREIVGRAPETEQRR